ncbi:MAG TPA: caspase family protein [Nitrospira sp.]|nr:caspase family protein [Nitrospira sp.]
MCALFLLFSASGCEKLSSAFKRTPLPEMGPRIDKSVKLVFDPAFTNLKMGYIDSCGSPHDLDVGAEVESVMIDAASQNFQAVSVAGGVAPQSPPDTEIQITLQRHALKLWTDNLYDRVPADLTLEALVSFKDRSGKELGQQTISIAHNQRLILEPTQHRCNYGNIDEFIYDSGVAMSVQFIRAAHTQFAGTGSPAPATVAGAPARPLASSPAPKASHPPLSFKATMLDENGNLVFEGGERMRIRVDVVNAGDQDLQQVAATLTGTPSVLSQFPATTLSIGRLQPGQSRSLEFAATLPQSVQMQKAELQVIVTDPGSEAPAPQMLSLSLQPTGVKADDVDQIPAVAEGFKRPQSYLLSVGIGSYRDQQLPSRKYGASDAEMVSTYFQSLGGLPASNVRLLQDWKALRPDIDEALLDWLPAHAGKDAVVMVYFAGQATVSPAGEVFLVPYDGNISTTSRAYPLKDLQAALSRLKTKQTILLFDGIVSRLGSDGRGKGTGPLWNPSGGSSVHIIATNGFGRPIEDEKHRHGLFTYYLLRALRGEADTNRDGEVTLGEAVSYLSQKVVWASKTQYGLEQRPLILPPLKSGDQSAALVLTKLATISASTVP